MAMLKTTITGFTVPQARACIKVADLRDFRLLVDVGTQTEYWRMLIGAYYALLSFATLLPLALSLMFGASKGASIAQSIVPYSRVPGIVSSSAAIFAFPFVFLFAVSVQLIIGDIWTRVSFICILVALVVYMRPGISAPSQKVIQRERVWRGRISLAFAVIALLAFVVALATRDLSRLLSTVVSRLNITVSAETREQIRNKVMWQIVNLVANFLGTSLISTVFFADCVTTVIQRFHHGEADDTLPVQFTRMRLVAELTALFKTKPIATVFPSSSGLLKQLPFASIDRLLRVQEGECGCDDTCSHVRVDADAGDATQNPEIMKVLRLAQVCQAVAKQERPCADPPQAAGPSQASVVGSAKKWSHVQAVFGRHGHVQALFGRRSRRDVRPQPQPQS